MLEDLSERTQNESNADRIFSDLEKKQLAESIASRISEDKIQHIFQQQTDSLRNELSRAMGLERLSGSSGRIIDRLRREIDDLRLRSNINLLIGMCITAGGLALLWQTIEILKGLDVLKTLAAEGADSNARFVKALAVPILPRILLVVFIEVFAYFFLRLYRDGLAEIKYFQNELTNVESKLAAVEFSYLAQNQDALHASLSMLSKTERNFILEKGQTTVELERARSDSEIARGIMRAIPSLFKKETK